MKEQLLRKIKSIFKRSYVSKSLPDTGSFPITQISYLGKPANTVVIWPYGMNARLPDGAECFTLNVEAMEENKASIGATPALRFKVDAEGEVSFGNPLTGSVTYYRSNGDIEVIGKNDQSVTLDGALNIIAINGVNITADVTITGDTAITGAVEITGDTTIIGNVGITGDMTISGTINGVIIQTHTHAQGNDAGGQAQVETEVPS